MSFEPRDAVDFLRLVGEAESSNRSDGLSDLRFSAGDQWPADVQNSRMLESRPCLTINKIDAHIRQITNAQRQQRPRIKVHPLDGAADPKIAEVITGLTRHIEVNSDADQAYDTAFNFAARIGWGYWRVETDYVREDSFDQDIFVRQIENPFTVYFDPNSTLPDGSDAEKALVTDLITKDSFKKQYPGADLDGFIGQGVGDSTTDWITKHDIRIAEYFTVERERDKLVMLSDQSIVYASQLPDPELLRRAGVWVTGDRESYRRKVMWRKVTALETLEEKEWAGRWIPIVPTYGDALIVDGKRKRFGMVRYARDPQMSYNFWRTAMTESVAMAPKAKWLMAEGQDEGHENEWAKANVSAYPVLRYKMTDIEGREAGRPERLQPEPPPSGAMEAAMVIGQDLQAVLGQFDPSMGKPSGPKSGTALRAEQGQSELSNFHYYDNLVRSIKHTGRIMLDLIPKIYDGHRVMRIIGDDGKPDLVQINQPNPGQPQDPSQGQPDPTAQAIAQVLNDVTVGTYDVVMEVGPSFNSKRAEAAESMSQMVAGNPQLMQIAGDLIFRNMDFPGADVIADRLAASNPLAKIDDKSDVPPQAQMMIKQLQAQLQQSQQQLQQAGLVLKHRNDLEQLKQEAETKRELMRVTGKAHDTETWSDLEMQKAALKAKTDLEGKSLDLHKAMSVEEIKAHLALLLSRMEEAGEQAASEAVERAI
jgi:hypothetical protein